MALAAAGPAAFEPQMHTQTKGYVMFVKVIAIGCEMPTPSGAMQTFPVNWEGPIPRQVGERWIAEGRAVEAGPAIAVDELTIEETVVLKRAVGQIIEQERDALAALEFEDMTVADLKAVAAQLQLDVGAKSRKADLVAALETHRAAVLGLNELTTEPVE